MPRMPVWACAYCSCLVIVGTRLHMSWRLDCWNSMELWNCAGYVTNFKQPTGGNLLFEDFKCPDSRCYSMKIIKGFRDWRTFRIGETTQTKSQACGIACKLVCNAECLCYNLFRNCLDAPATLARIEGKTCNWKQNKDRLQERSDVVVLKCFETLWWQPKGVGQRDISSLPNLPCQRGGPWKSNGLHLIQSLCTPLKDCVASQVWDTCLQLQHKEHFWNASRHQATRSQWFPACASAQGHIKAKSWWIVIWNGQRISLSIPFASSQACFRLPSWSWFGSIFLWIFLDVPLQFRPFWLCNRFAALVKLYTPIQDNITWMKHKWQRSPWHACLISHQHPTRTPAPKHAQRFDWQGAVPWLRHFAKGFETLQNRTNSFGSWFHRTHVVSSHPEASLLPHCSGMRQQHTGTRLTFNFYILLPSCIESKQTHTHIHICSGLSYRIGKWNA